MMITATLGPITRKEITLISCVATFFRDMMERIMEKVCFKCKELKVLELFGRNKQRKDGRSSNCKSCEAARSRARNATPEGKAYKDNYMKEWMEKPGNREKRAASSKEHYNRDGNKEKQMAAQKARRATPQGQKWLNDPVNKLKKLDCMRRWRKTDHGKMQSKINGNKHRATKLHAVPVWYDAELVDMVYRAAKARTVRTGIRHEVDHIVPLKGVNVCGLHCYDNLQILTKSENCAKGNRHVG